jgi:hypothetical protein
MAHFDFTGDEVSIIDDYNHSVQLNPQQALDLMRWLFERQDDLLIVLQPPTQPLRLERKKESK